MSIPMVAASIVGDDQHVLEALRDVGELLFRDEVRNDPLGDRILAGPVALETLCHGSVEEDGTDALPRSGGQWPVT